MNRTLVLFTAGFPYWLHDNFLDEELVFLAKQFEKIIIYPYLQGKIERTLPSNVVVDDTFAQFFASRWKKAFRAGLNCFRSRELLQEIFREPKVLANRKALIRLIGFSSQAEGHYKILKKIIQEKPELENALFYTYWFYQQTAGLCLLKKRDFPNLKVITRAHGYDLYAEDYEPYYIPWRGQCLESLDAVHLISQNGLHYLAERYPDQQDKLKVSYLGVKDPGFLNKPTGLQELSIVSCSQLVPLKRVDKIIEAIEHFSITHPTLKIRWNHLGGGDLQEKLQQLALSKLEGRVEWKIHGHLKNEKIMEFYRDNPIDVFISASTTEGIPVSMMEALACGIPVIAPNVGGVSEIVEDSNGILLSSYPEIKEISCALFSVKIDNEIFELKRRGAREVWNKRFNSIKNHDLFSKTINLIN
jgi:colanic acid/amylovoran biosynthesis glycosyltransferase